MLKPTSESCCLVLTDQQLFIPPTGRPPKSVNPAVEKLDVQNHISLTIWEMWLKMIGGNRWAFYVHFLFTFLYIHFFFIYFSNSFYILLIFLFSFLFTDFWSGSGQSLRSQWFSYNCENINNSKLNENTKTIWEVFHSI